jgi:hypothetical protein
LTIPQPVPTSHDATTERLDDFAAMGVFTTEEAEC